MSQQPFAQGKKAYGFCDRCGFRYWLRDLKYQYVNRTETSLRVCPPCLDIDHEQLQLGRVHTIDPQALRDPRPDQSQNSSNSLFGFEPVGNPGTHLTGKAGQAHVTT